MSITKSAAGRRRTADRRLLSAIALMLALAGCQKKPGGQVAAVVNSDEITQQELRMEAEAAGIPPSQDLQSYAPTVLSRVVDRTLLAQYAHQQGIDRSPEFVARRRQIEQSLLATLALRKIAGQPAAPSTAQVQSFIAENPAMFGSRERLALDQIRFATPADPTRIKPLVALGSLDAIATKLRGDNVPFARGTTSLDTGTVEPGISRQIEALKNGELFDLSTGGTTFVSVITTRTAMATPQAAWAPAAANAVRRSAAQKTVADAVAKLRAKAKISYDPVLVPSLAKGSPAPAH